MRCIHSVTGLLLITTFASIIPIYDAGLCSEGRSRIYDRYYKKTELLRSRDALYPQGVFIFNGKPGLVRANGLCHDLTTKKDSNEVKTPILTTIQDVKGNRMFTNDKGHMMVHVSAHHREYRVSDNIDNARFAISRDRQNMFAFDSKKGSDVYMFNTQKPNICPKDTISLIKVIDLGSNVYSLAIDNVTGNIITAQKNNSSPGEWSVQVYTKLDSNPCQSAASSDQKFRDSTQAVMEAIMSKYKIDTGSNSVTCNKSTKNRVMQVKCDNLEAFRTMLHTKLSEINVLHGTRMTDVREYYKNGDHINTDDPTINKCQSENTEDLFALFAAPKPEPEGNNNVITLNRDLQTLIEGADLIGPFFNTSVFGGSISANEIEEFSRRNYVCVDKTKVKRWQESATAAEEQFQYLVNGLGIIRSTLAPTSEAIESAADVVDGSEGTPNVDDPANILSQIDVRFNS